MQVERRDHTKWGRLFLVRHGESTCNAINRLAGAVDAPLTSLGEAQARRAGRQWRGRPPERIYVSPLQRAIRTAEILFPSAARDGHTESELVIDDRITERNFGELALMNKALLQRRIGLAQYERALYGDCMAMACGESFSAFHERVFEFLRDELHPLLVAGKRVVVVAHKYVIELLSRLILRLPVVNGFDIRLPNAKLLNGGSLHHYVKKETRFLNHARDWVVLRYARLLLFGVLVGMLLNHLGVVIPGASVIGVVLLGLATGLSLATVDLSTIPPRSSRSSIPVLRVLARYLLLPVVLGFLGYLGEHPWLLAMALLSAAPAAVTSVVISRCLGGLILPSVYIIVLSTLLGAVSTILLLLLHGTQGIVTPLVTYLGIAGAALLLPLLAARLLRQHFPIEATRFAERNGALAVILLSLFVVLAFQKVDMTSFWVEGVWAFGIGLCLRAVAFLMARHNTLCAVDDYVAMANPNVFLVLLLASSLGMEALLPICAWFLLPMFALAPLDEWLTRRMNLAKTDARLLRFLKVETVLMQRYQGSA